MLMIIMQRHNDLNLLITMSLRTPCKLLWNPRFLENLIWELLVWKIEQINLILRYDFSFDNMKIMVSTICPLKPNKKSAARNSCWR